METTTLNLNGLKSLAPPRLDKCNQETLIAYFKNTWELYELLFSSINEDRFLYTNPDPLRHPLIFYLGHTAVFYINKLVIAGLMDESERINAHFEKLFEQGVDPAKSEELGTEAWPSVEAVRAYRVEAYDRVLDFIAGMDFNQQVNADHPFWSIFMGLEHDRIHFETSSMLIRHYPVDWVTRPDEWSYGPTDTGAPANDWIPVPGGEIQLGKPHDFPTFGWDNEYGSLKVPVADFEASRNLVTNAEFMEFVQAGGYGNQECWTEEGWDWVSRFKVAHPRFWVKKGETFLYRAMFDEMEIPGSWPVEVNCHEATAYCNWKGNGTRLLSEAEFRCLARTAISQPFDLVLTDDFNLNLKFCSPTPVGMLETAASTLGFNDVWGNVWCWLSNDFYPLPGFKIHDYYKDFSEPYMDSEHATLLGGSWATSGTAASKYYRLWFRRHFYQHAGFRMARDL